MAPTTRPTDARPPHVTRGAKLHTTLKSPEIGLDWIRCVGPASLAPRVSNWLRRSFGDPQAVKGRYRFGSGKQYQSGALLFEDHAGEWKPREGDHTPADDAPAMAGLCCVEFTGSVLAAMPPVERVRVLRRLVRLGFRCTRVDVALDFRDDEGVGLIGSMLSSCHAGHLCGARTFEEIHRESSGALQGWTVYAGRRGKAGSGRLVRCYDKGLESKTAPAGTWERFEAEFTRDTAHKAAIELVQANDWTDAAAGLALGSIDFRERRGLSRALARRPRCSWWERVIRAVRLRRVVVTRRTPTLETYALWLRRAVAPMLARIAAETHRTVSSVWAELVGDVDPSMSPAAAMRVFEFRRFGAAALTT